MLGHYAAGDAGGGKTRAARNGRQGAASAGRGRTSRQIVVITVLTVISSSCGKVTEHVFLGACRAGHRLAGPPIGTSRRDGAGHGTLALRVAAPRGLFGAGQLSGRGIYIDRATLYRGFINFPAVIALRPLGHRPGTGGKGRRGGEQRRSFRWTAGCGAPGRPDRPTCRPPGWVSFFLALDGLTASVFI